MLRSIYILILVIVTSKNIIAQSKIGCVYRDNIIALMPEVTKANTILKQYQDSLVNETEKLEETYNKRMKDWYYGCHDLGYPLPDSIRQRRREETIEMITKIQNAGNICQELAKQKAAELFSPIQNKFNDVVKQVAKENGYRYVFDFSDVRVQFLPLPAYDNITDLILCKLNL